MIVQKLIYIFLINVYFFTKLYDSYFFRVIIKYYYTKSFNFLKNFRKFNKILRTGVLIKNNYINLGKFGKIYLCSSFFFINYSFL